MLETEPTLIQEYVATGKARLIYRHLAQLGSTSHYLGEVTECAGTQGAFWEMRDLVYRRQGELGRAAAYGDVASLVQELKLDQAQFQQCLDGGQFAAQVDNDYAQAQQEGITSRPVLDINGQRLIGALSLDRYRQTLDATH